MSSPPSRTERIRLAELVAALSLATDLGMGQPLTLALRACVLAVRLGDALGLGEDELRHVYYTTLLRHAGCTADATHTASAFGDEIVARTWLALVDFGRPSEMLGTMLRRVGAGAAPLRRIQRLVRVFTSLPQVPDIQASHCEVAQHLAARLGLGAGVQTALGQIFERWDGRGLPRHVRGEAIARPARIAMLAREAALFARIGGVEAAVATVRQRRGGAYEPQVADRFCADATHLLAGLDDGSLWDTALAAEPGIPAWLTAAEVDEAARAIGDFADLISPFFVGHASGVADLAAAAAATCGLADAEVAAVRRAGWLHDVGRTGVTAAIWNMPGPLSDLDWERVRLHPYYTARVLARVTGVEAVAALAAAHHERLDGSGYHRGVPAGLQPLGARILAAADAYHALTHARPHRPAHPPTAAAGELHAAVSAGRLDGDAVHAVLLTAGHQVRPRHPTWPAGLSSREVEVLRLLAQGHTNRQIAAALVVAPATVDHHIRHIYTKLSVSTRAAATMVAMQHQLLDVHPAV